MKNETTWGQIASLLKGLALRMLFWVGIGVLAGLTTDLLGFTDFIR